MAGKVERIVQKGSNFVLNCTTIRLDSKTVIEWQFPLKNQEFSNLIKSEYHLRLRNVWELLEVIVVSSELKSWG